MNLLSSSGFSAFALWQMIPVFTIGVYKGVLLPILGQGTDEEN
jgi:hypothetical protein